MRSSLFQIPEEWTNTAPPKSKSPVPTAEPSESSAKSRLCEIPDELLNSVVNHLVVRLPEDLNKDCPDWPSLVALSLTNKQDFRLLSLQAHHQCYHLMIDRRRDRDRGKTLCERYKSDLYLQMSS